MAVIDSRPTFHNARMALIDCVGYALLSSIVVGTILLIRHVRTRHSSNDTEMSSSSSPAVGRLSLDLPSSSPTQSPTDDFDLLKTLLDNNNTPPSNVTSGFLAAKADMERTDGTELVNMAELDMDFSPPPPYAGPRGFFDEDDTTPSRPVICYSNPPSKSRLREDACRDQSQHFQDTKDLALIWRRRTMMFGSTL
ncbi:hypothetical protein PV10_01022 [Exophiala mesophila]|uniref:Uncharacterized protein n=1 Tax=Exophiala mesophila TaxID=212818 RepID=A0A0D1Y973_EXOME|nr:uncharacterized protein PV10_01022 [Exophiala mesophila]KIV97251.1 hypothetical protein PV10_01022 [Exophiala mesophila]